MKMTRWGGEQERQEAEERFGQEVADNLRSSLERALAENESLQKRNEMLEDKLVEAQHVRDRLGADVKRATRQLADKDHELERLVAALRQAHQAVAS